MRNSKGITLISLVVTIIVMLILAGVALNLITGGDGILGKSETAVNETEKQAATEKINFKITSKQMDSYAENGRNATLQELAEFLDADDEIEYVNKKTEETADLDWIDDGDYESILTKLYEYPYVFEIDSNLRLASVDGVKIADSTSNSSITEEQISAIIDQKLSEYATKTDLNNYATKTELSNYATKDSLTNIERTVLWSSTNGIEFASSTTVSDPGVDITLSEDISSYKYIEFQYDIFASNTQGYFGERTALIAVDQIKTSSTADYTNGSIILLQNHSDTTLAGFFKNNTTFRVCYTHTTKSDYSKIRIRKICGIK